MIQLYMDHHVDGAVTSGLRQRGVDVLSAFEDRGQILADPDLLDRATALRRVLHTNDRDFLAEAADRQRAGIEFSGIIFATQRGISIGDRIDDLELIAKVMEPVELENVVLYLPL